MTARAFHSGYYDGHRRAGQVRRCHVMREDGKWAGKWSLCGQYAWDATNAPVIILDPMPAKVPDGLTWCPRCIGILAEHLGALDVFAAELAGVSR